VLYHSCGSLTTLLDHLVEMGVEAINPVQVSAGGMGDTAELKRRWGDRITFWGGIDSHKVLPRGTEMEVKEEVWQRLDDLAVDGGYVLASVHDIQSEVPPENIKAMFRAADEWSAKG
jgi:uroporphyrinogen decarboxylase